MNLRILTRPEDLGESNTGPSKGLGQTQTRPKDLGESKHLARLIDLGNQSFPVLRTWEKRRKGERNYFKLKVLRLTSLLSSRLKDLGEL